MYNILKMIFGIIFWVLLFITLESKGIKSPPLYTFLGSLMTIIYMYLFKYI